MREATDPVDRQNACHNSEVVVSIIRWLVDGTGLDWKIILLASVALFRMTPI